LKEVLLEERFVNKALPAKFHTHPVIISNLELNSGEDQVNGEKSCLNDEAVYRVNGGDN
jgi:hypothetical protein